MNFCLLLQVWVQILVTYMSKNLGGKYSPGMLAIRKKLLDNTNNM